MSFSLSFAQSQRPNSRCRWRYVCGPDTSTHHSPSVRLSDRRRETDCQCHNSICRLSTDIWPVGPIIKNLNVSIDRHNNMAHINNRNTERKRKRKKGKIINLMPTGVSRKSRSNSIPEEANCHFTNEADNK